jgi:ceramide glucosyltransferase
VQEASDPSVALVQKLQESFPQLEIILAIGQPHLGINPKINNLANALPHIRHDFLVIADSDIKVNSDYLKNIIQPFKTAEIGVVTCLYRSVTQGWLAGFESLDIATTFVPKILTARFLEGVDFAFGSTITLRREVLEKIGGLASMANHLADDYQLGHLPVVAGYQGFLSSYIVEHHLGNVTWREMLARQIRWQKCVRVERFWGYLGLFFTQGTVLSTFWLVLTQASRWGWLVFLTLWLARYLTVYVTAIALFQDPTAKQFWLWTPLRDFLTFGLWCYSLGGDRVTWRGKTYQLLPDGQLSPLP